MTSGYPISSRGSFVRVAAGVALVRPNFDWELESRRAKVVAALREATPR